VFDPLARLGSNKAPPVPLRPAAAAQAAALVNYQSRFTMGVPEIDSGQRVTLARKANEHSRFHLYGRGFGAAPVVTVRGEQSTWRVASPHVIIGRSPPNQCLCIQVMCVSVEAALTRRNFIGNCTITIDNGEGEGEVPFNPTAVYIDDVLHALIRGADGGDGNRGNGNDGGQAGDGGGSEGRAPTGKGHAGGNG
jgi:hypothetical protein